MIKTYVITNANVMNAPETSGKIFATANATPMKTNEMNAKKLKSFVKLIFESAMF